MAADVPKVLNTPPAIAEASMKPAPAGLVALGPFVFDCDNGLLWRDGVEIPLPPRAVGLLTCLVERAGDVVPKQALLDRVWKDTFVTETSLVEAVSLLRQTLQDDPQRPSFIQTVPRRGYRLVAPVQPIDGADHAALDRMRAVRSRDAGAAAVAPDVAMASAAGDEAVWPAWLGWTFAGVALVALAAVSAGLLGQPGVRERPVVRFAIDTPLVPPSREPVAPLVAVSPDGRRLAFVAAPSGQEEPRIYVRDVDRLELRTLAGTEGAAAPFFSPDGRWIGFFAHRSLKKVPVGSGPVVTLADSPQALGATWLPDDTIVFGGGRSRGLSRVSARGGTPATVTTPDYDGGEIRHAWPDAAASGRGLVFTALAADGAPESARVAAVDLASGRVHALVAPAVYGRLAPPAHLLFTRGGAVLAAPIDEETWSLVGQAIAVLREPIVDEPSGVAHLAVSRSGVLVTATQSAGDGGLERMGRMERTGLSDRDQSVRSSVVGPGGRRALAIGDGDDVDLYVSDATGSTRLTSGGGVASPVWTADGAAVVYASRTGGAFNLFMRPARPNAAETRLTTSVRSQLPSAVSADGSTIVFTQVEPETGMDVWLLPIDASTPATPAVRAPGDQMAGVLSPDGRWLVYASEAARGWAVMARDRSKAGQADATVLETDGVGWPDFSSDGATLTVALRRGPIACAVSDRGFRCEAPAQSRPPEPARAAPYGFQVVLDWSRELSARVPPAQQPVRSVR
jgi:DNA-binding winged helix-turn-helix (wHTH) protein/Tol biopolymer transport system component